MNAETEEQKPLGNIQRGALSIGTVAALASLIGAFIATPAFFHAYLFAYLFWLAIALGSLGLLMVHHITGGGWGFVLRRLFEAAAMTLPLLALFFIPILFGMPHLFAWSRPEVMASDPVLQHKSHFFLSVPWFIVRAVIYFAIWIGMAALLRRWSLQQDRMGDSRLTARFQHFCGPGLVLYVLTMSLAAIDWIMSLEPRWYSTVFGLIVLCGQGLNAFAFTIPVAIWIANRTQWKNQISPEVFRALGSMLLTFVLLWTYTSFSQYLIIWSGDLASEVPWYLHRGEDGWKAITVFLILFHFFVPFVLLLFGQLKRSQRMLSLVALSLLLAHLVDNYWQVMPTFSPTLRLHWLDFALPLALGGLWMAWFAWQVQGKALVPQHDPRLEAYFQAKEASAHG